jgi:glucose PTS system EIICBA or EIICB component
MSQTGSRVFGTLQRIGQALMIPVSVLPAAGLLVALGRLLQKAAESGDGQVTNTLLHGVGDVFFTGGLAIFEQLPVVFAVGVAIGFTGGAAVAGLAAVVGYFTLANVLKTVGDVRQIGMVINTGVFGGIAVGMLSAALYKRFHQTKLHPVFGFFAGKRLVPIVTAGASIVLALVLAYVWPPIQGQIKTFGEYVMGSDLGPAFYAAGKRLLIPVGLHHVYYPSFLFEFGEYVTAAGKVLHGESARYFAGDPNAGRFMASEFPIMLFGLPAATLAMYLRAEKSRRKAVAGIMLSAALTSIVTGITEPIEFAFIFVAPILFVFHVLAAFVSGLLTGWFDIHLGYTFSASVIDFALGFFNQKNSLVLFLLVGPAVALTYFGVFYTLIGWLNLKTPGREDADAIATSEVVASTEKAAAILKAIGGKDNIRDLDACITRLRLSVFNDALVNEARLKELGAAGVMRAGGGNFQIIFGVESDQLKDQILASFREVIVCSPLAGRLMNISEVPDATFAQKMLGDGLAIDPTDSVVRSPVDAKVAQVFRTNHAIGLVTEGGLEFLIHVGIDTVKMKGRGFRSFVATGDSVKAGDKLLEFDLDAIRQEGKSAITPVLITNVGDVQSLELLKTGIVGSADAIMRIRV